MVTFGRGAYRPILELGRGGMSRVYLCAVEGADASTPLVVVKTLLPELTTDPEFFKMFREEVRLSARLDHPNVIRSYSEPYLDDDEPILVMEYLDGQSLEHVVRKSKARGGVPLDVHLRVILEAARGVHYAHELRDDAGQPLQVVHRDLSPHNVFVTYDGQIKVLDFGIARAADTDGRTSAGILKGKSAYMAPEQLHGSAFVDRRTDVFALGVMTWQAATGQRIWAGMSDLEIFHRLSERLVPSPLEVSPTLDPALVGIIQRATAAEREARTPTAAALADDLEAYLAGRGELVPRSACASYVADLFVDRRARVRTIVDRALASTDSDLEALGLESMSLPSSMDPRSGGHRTTQPVVVEADYETPPPPSARDPRREATLAASVSGTPHSTRRKRSSAPTRVAAGVLLVASAAAAAALVFDARREALDAANAAPPAPAMDLTDAASPAATERTAEDTDPAAAPGAPR